MADNLEAVRSVYDAFARGDVPAVLAVLGPDVSWTEAEGFPYGGVWNLRNGKVVRFRQYTDTAVVQNALR